jgi:catechol 2,3-dioxygenase-like lactoylglutathione lyase family enzyme
VWLILCFSTAYMLKKKKLIYGIQQIGLGTDDAYKSFDWYSKTLGSSVIVFEDKSEATYMAPYMGGQAHKKRAILAMNPLGGSGYELWQYLDREPQKPTTPTLLGDLGINAVMVKSTDIDQSFKNLKAKNVSMLSSINTEPDGQRSFYIEDENENTIKIKEFDSWYSKKGNDTGGPFGCVIGVSDMETSLNFYTDILEYDQIVYDQSGVFPDLFDLKDGISHYRRVLLTTYKKRKGGFSDLLGESQIELIQCLDGNIKRKKIFKDRYWGDHGFIHLAFDVRNLDLLVKECAEKGFPFQVLSNGAFDMGSATGYWGYIEDPDGTLIEFVETHKVPIIKWLNFNINLLSRNPQKPLPGWMIKAMLLKKNEVSH